MAKMPAFAIHGLDSVSWNFLKAPTSYEYFLSPHAHPQNDFEEDCVCEDNLFHSIDVGET